MNEMIGMWNSRYADEDYAYGTEPNVFFKDTVEKYNLSGSLLLPAEGEGRNAVYAAKRGLKVTAFDISAEGEKKARKLAKKENVEIIYEVGNFFDLDLIHKEYDAAALIYAHFPPHLLSNYYSKIGTLIKPNGLVILEGFSKKHLKYSAKDAAVGGPNNLEMLLSKASVLESFPNFEVLCIEEVEAVLNEGKFHNGVGSVIRFVGRKK